jgi:hypothetical protein
MGIWASDDLVTSEVRAKFLNIVLARCERSSWTAYLIQIHCVDITFIRTCSFSVHKSISATPLLQQIL